MNVWDELSALATLPPNWDSYGAIKVTETAITSASGLMTAPLVSALPDGGVSVRWTNTHMEIDVSILADGSFGDLTVERFILATGTEEP